jgi:predicted chitinase
VQLTGRANYGVVGRALGLGDLLLREPEQANELRDAARDAGAFRRIARSRSSGRLLNAISRSPCR